MAKTVFKLKNNKKKVKDEKLDIPIDISNEQYILTCVIKFKELQSIFFDMVNHDDFLNTINKSIAWSIIETIKNERKVTGDMLTLVVNNYHGKKFSKKYLYSLINDEIDTPTVENFKHHVNKLKSDKVKNKLYSGYSDSLNNLLRNPHSQIETIIEKIEFMRMYIENETLMSNNIFMSMNQINDEYVNVIIEREKGTEFQKVFYQSIDRDLTEGLAKKRISLIAGRPGMGKSAFVDNIALNLSRRKIPVGIFSLEMDRVSVYDRFISILSGINLMKIIRDRNLLLEHERQKEKDIRKIISKLPIYIYDKSAPSLDVIHKQIKYLKETSNVNIFFIDLFDKIKVPSHLRGKSTTDEISYMLNFFQRLVRTLDVHICIINQIGRAVEKRSDKKPRVSDLKNSGSFEEISDLILLLYREKCYSQSDAKGNKQDILEVKIGKQRQGIANKTIELRYVSSTTKIMECNNDL